MNSDKIDHLRNFEMEREARVTSYSADQAWQASSLAWIRRAFEQRYMYNFSWLGRPIIQFPADMVALQEIVWATKPDLIIETGIAHGGSLIMSASLLSMLDYCDALAQKAVLDPANARRHVLGIDIDIRAHNRAAIEAHPLSQKITMIEGSSVDVVVASRVKTFAARYANVLVCLDSNHTAEHVLKELELYAPLVSIGSYCIVFDTIVEDMPQGQFPDRPWKPGDGPKTAIEHFLRKQAHYSSNNQQEPLFSLDVPMHEKLLISALPGGFLQRVR